MLFDSHTHIQFNAYADDRDAVIARAQKAGISMNCIGTQIATSKAAIKLAEQHDHIYASVGIHPIQHDVVKVEEESDSFVSRGEQWDQALFAEMAAHPKVIAVGETGLDKFHIRHDIALEEVFDKQITLFKQHYALAKQFDLPLVIHVRDAHEEMLELLESFGESIRGVIHCFTGNKKQMERYTALGLYFGLGGVITYPPKKSDPKPQEDLIEAVEAMPLDRILTETDAPYLAPQGHRGKRNEPAYMSEVAEMIAALRGMTYEEVEQLTVENGKTLFSKMNV